MTCDLCSCRARFVLTHKTGKRLAVCGRHRVAYLSRTWRERRL